MEAFLEVQLIIAKERVYLAEAMPLKVLKDSCHRARVCKALAVDLLKLTQLEAFNFQVHHNSQDSKLVKTQVVSKNSVQIIFLVVQKNKIKQRQMWKMVSSHNE